MELEQTRPNKPNFLRVVLLAAATILIVLFVVLALIHFDGKRLMPHVLKANTSRLVLPGVSDVQAG